MNTWYTSDFHLDHENIIKFSNRPYKDVQEMNQAIFNEYKDKVKNGDHVYYLGDLSWSKELIYYFFKNVYKKSHHFFWILGNHDYRFKSVYQEIESVYQNVHIIDGMKDIKIPTPDGKQSITLCHYPMLTWNRSHFNAWQLYGHHHNNHINEILTNPEIPTQGKQLNVSWDYNKFKFLSFDDVKKIMETKPDNFDFIKE